MAGSAWDVASSSGLPEHLRVMAGLDQAAQCGRDLRLVLGMGETEADTAGGKDLYLDPARAQQRINCLG